MTRQGYIALAIDDKTGIHERYRIFHYSIATLTFFEGPDVGNIKII